MSCTKRHNIESLSLKAELSVGHIFYDFLLMFIRSMFPAVHKR